MAKKKKEKNKPIVFMVVPGIDVDKDTDGEKICWITQVSPTHPEAVGDAIASSLDKYDIFIINYQPSIPKILRDLHLLHVFVMPDSTVGAPCAACLRRTGLDDTSGEELRQLAVTGMLETCRRISKESGIKFIFEDPDKKIDMDLINLIRHGSVDDLAERMANGTMSVDIDSRKDDTNVEEESKEESGTKEI